MVAVRGAERRRLINANLLLISRSDFPGIGRAIQTADPYIVMNSPWDDLHPLKVGRENHDVTPSSICLKKKTCSQESF